MIDTNEKYGTLWTKEETILCFFLYCQIPFNKTNKSNPEVVQLARLIGRTVGSVVRKLGNLGAVDDRLRALNISGLTNYAKLDKEVFDEFVNNWEKLVSDSHEILSKINIPNDFSRETLNKSKPEKDLIAEYLRLSRLPTEKKSTVIVRVRQDFFRKSVLSNYSNKCCISGVEIPELLVASHIVPWSENQNIRIDPQNGLLLSALHDKAFDTGLITVTPDYKVKVSKKIYRSKSDFVRRSFLEYDGKEIDLSSKFLPKKDYLIWHNKNCFEK